MIKVFLTITQNMLQLIGLGYKLRTKPKCITNIKFSNIPSITIVWFQKTSIPPPPPRGEFEIPEGLGGGVKSPGKSRGEGGGGERINYFLEGQCRFIPM